MKANLRKKIFEDNGKFQLKRVRRYFVSLHLLSSDITPTPDVVNQSLMAVPMLLLYEVGIWILGTLREGHREMKTNLRKKMFEDDQRF